MEPRLQKVWEEFLNPDVIRPRLIAASIYIACFEALKDAIVGRIRDLFLNGFDQTGDIIDPKYDSKVLSRNKSPVYASLEWLKESAAINDVDIRAFNRVKDCRNNIAHRLFTLLGSEGLPPDFENCFSDMVSLLHKIEVWWIKNFEIPINPEYDGRDVDEKEIVPGRIMSLQLLIDIALGDEAKSRLYYEEFRKRAPRDWQNPPVPDSHAGGAPGGAG